MKASEIKVGQVLLETRDQNPFKYRHGGRKVTVVETGATLRGTLTKGTKVRDENGTEYPVSNSRLKMPWAEYVAQCDRIDQYAAERRGQREREQIERAERALELDTTFRRAGIAPKVFSAYVTITPMLVAGGWEVTDHKVTTVFPNLREHVEKGTPLTVYAEQVADAVLGSAV